MAMNESFKTETYRDTHDKITHAGNFIILPLAYLRIMSLEEAVMLATLMNIAIMEEGRDRFMEPDWFKCSSAFLKKRLELTERESRNYLSKLEKKGYIERKMFGNPAKRFIRINRSRVEDGI